MSIHTSSISVGSRYPIERHWGQSARSISKTGTAIFLMTQERIEKIAAILPESVMMLIIMRARWVLL